MLLDRARFSPGAIDGLAGDNLRDAIKAYQQQQGLDASGLLDPATWDKLTAKAPPTVKAYVTTAQDAKGPFTTSIPTNFEAQSRLPRLGYHNVREALAERFHMGEPLLRALNPKSSFKAGDHIVVADVARSEPAGKAARLVVDKSGHDVEALDVDGKMLARYPASIGSTDKPAPTGDLTIHEVRAKPGLHLRPQLQVQGGERPRSRSPSNRAPTIPWALCGWILAATAMAFTARLIRPKSARRSRTAASGLTNWDALDLASMVGKGTAVHFGDEPGSTGPVPPVPATPAPTPVETPMAAAPTSNGDHGKTPVPTDKGAGVSASAIVPADRAKP